MIPPPLLEDDIARVMAMLDRQLRKTLLSFAVPLRCTVAIGTSARSGTN